MIDTYLCYLLKELDLTIQHHREDIDHSLDTLYLGGGTPSLMTPKDLSRVMQGISNYIKFDEKTEVTLEMDPGTFDKVKI